MEKNAKIYLAGHTGLVGSAILRSLQAQGYSQFFAADDRRIRFDSVNLQLKNLLKQEHPDIVILAAAKVGGIYANDTFPADFIYVNLQLENNIIHSAYQYRRKKTLFFRKLLYLSEICSTANERRLFAGWKIRTHKRTVSIAKIAGIKMCQAYNRAVWNELYFCHADQSVRASR